MKRIAFLIGMTCLFLSGCSVVVQNRVFPKLDWYWSKDAQMERDYTRQEKADRIKYQESLTKTNL